MRLNTRAAHDPRALKWTADAFEQARELRIQTAERIRSGLASEEAPAPGADRLLESILRGEGDGPLPVLGRVYRRNWEQEREMERILAEQLGEHPAWGWMKGVPGIDPVIAGQLLARLDVTRAATPSSFWAYCGLATVPARRFRCTACGWERSLAEGAQAPATHVAPGSGASCDQPLVQTAGPGTERVAQPKAQQGTRGPYDAEARKICQSLGASLRRAGHAYEGYYQEERRKLDSTRPDWANGRKHMTALRKMEKLFLAHLWLVWRAALELPVTEPFPGSRSSAGDPWSMTVGEGRRRWTRPQDTHPDLRIRT